LNRDYVKADAPEMQAWLRVFTAWRPEFFIDNHVTDGQDYQYDVTVSVPVTPELWPTAGDWARDTYLPALFAAMEKDGHFVAPYGGPADPRDPAKGFVSPTFSPRFSHAYTPLHNRPSLLVETHSLKHYRTQVWAHYDIMVHTLRLLSPELKRAVAEADRAVAALAGTGSLPVAFRVNRTEGEPFVYRDIRSVRETSQISGGPVTRYLPEPVNIETRLFRKVEPVLTVRVPAAYAIPPEWTAIIERLRLHGIRLETLAREEEREVEVFRLDNPKWAEQPFEGRHLLSYNARPSRERRHLPAGTVIVPMNQPAARAALHLLEPDAPDALVRWGLIDAIFEQKEYFSDYVFEPIARRMLDQDPRLKAEFDAKLGSDPKFAANPRERLRWLYERSPYFESDRGVYPVFRVLK
jgi:hypothetical protein